MIGSDVEFSAETFARRRAMVMSRLEGGAMVLPSAPVLHRSRETEARYRPDSELYYLTGIVEPGVVAVLNGSDREPFVLFVPAPDPSAEVWTGPRMALDKARELFGADAVFPAEEIETLLPGFLRSRRRLYFRLGAHAGVEPLVVAALDWGRKRGPRKGGGPRALIDPGEILDDLRLQKDPVEIASLRAAAALTVSSFREAIGRTRPGMGEWEVEALLESSFRRGGGAGPAFPTIVGSGANGCVLHYVRNKDVIREGNLVLLDGGAEVGLYAGDVSRTFPAGGRFDSRQRDVYAVVLRAHQAAVSRVRPGITLSEVHDAVREELVSGLVELGVIEGDVQDLLAGGAPKPYFPHQTSHWLGMDVHDVGDYVSPAGPRKLEPGMVLTIEPGLYFPPGTPGPSNPFDGVGIRIEDDLLVTETGAENLTESLPVTPDEVEALVGTWISGKP